MPKTHKKKSRHHSKTKKRLPVDEIEDEEFHSTHGKFVCDTHVDHGKGNSNMTTTTCICNGMDCLGSINLEGLFSRFFGGGGEKHPPKKDDKIGPLEKYDPATDKIRIKLDKLIQNSKDQDITQYKIKPPQNIPLVLIDPSKITNKHCTTFGTKDTPYVYKAQLNLNDQHKEAWYSEGMYDNTPNEELPPFFFNTHLGQRKLMLSEMQVLLKYYEINPNVHPTVLYIGSAPGLHLTTLSRLFPHVKFILYDGAIIYKVLKKNPKFEVHDSTTEMNELDKTDPDSINDGFFTIAKCKRVAKTLDKDSLIFISDIRLTQDNMEEGVLRDMNLQKEWMKILTPKLSLVKFRMPWKLVPEITYFKGSIFYGIWPPSKSTETRLMVTQKDIIENNTIIYDVKNYDDILFYHNKYRRTFCQAWIPKIFEKYITSKNNIYCSCYDCISELNVLLNYSTATGTPFDKTVLIFGRGLNKKPDDAFPRGKFKRRDH
jgi:hypothetical protein